MTPSQDAVPLRDAMPSAQRTHREYVYVVVDAASDRFELVDRAQLLSDESTPQMFDADQARSFQRLASIWRRERGATSSTMQMAQHPAYKRIVAMGTDALPFILADLQKRHDHWFIALRQITGDNPVTEVDRGRMDRVAAAWLRWGREHGYIA